MIERLEENIKGIEGQVRAVAAGDRMVELLMTIPGCGEIGAWTIRAYTNDVKRFGSAKKYAAYAGLVPWVHNSNETVRHGKITKRGPQELRTAMVQLVMGVRRMKKKTCAWRMMRQYEAMKQSKIPGKAIIATARKIATVIWHMLNEDTEFEEARMIDQKLAKKSEAMSKTARLVNAALVEKEEKPVPTLIGKKREKKAGVAREKRKKAG
jgi:hydrogenase maturation factor